MKYFYRKYRVGEIIRVSEREYNGGDDPLNRAKRNINAYKVIQDYPLFVVCERKSRSNLFSGPVTIRTSFLKWDLEHGVVQCV